MIARVLVAGIVVIPLLTVWTSTQEVTSGQIAWLKSHAIPLKTVEAGRGFADLQQLKAAIGSARIVSLGEATHGTREIFQMKHRLIEFLASELGFTIFSIEANMPEAYRVNDYVLHGEGDPKALLRGMYFWTWNTEEVLAMIEWMRRFNASGRGRIEFTGFDMQTPDVAMEIVERWLQTADAKLAAKVRVAYQAARNLTLTQGGFGVATGTFPVTAAAGKKIRFSGAIKTSNVQQGFAGLWWRADGPNGVLAFDNMDGRAPSGTTAWQRYQLTLEIPRETVNINFGMLMPGTGAAWFDDLQLEIDGKPYDAGPAFDFDFESGQIIGFVTPATDYLVRVDGTTASRGTHSLRIESRAAAAGANSSSAADVTRACAEIVAAMEGARGAFLKRGIEPATVDWAIQNARVVHQYTQMKANEFSRDESMARNVKWILDTAPKNTRAVLWAHNWHVSRFQMGGNRSMGAYLNEWYGKDHLAIGFAIGRGEYTAVMPGKGLARHRLTPPETGSYESAFARTGMPRFILDLRPARSDDAASGWLRRTMKLRYIAAMATDQQFQPANLASLFDFIVYLDETSATRVLVDAQ